MEMEKELADVAVNNYIEYENKYAASLTLEEYWAKTGKCKKFIRRNLNGNGKIKVSNIGLHQLMVF